MSYQAELQTEDTTSSLVDLRRTAIRYWERRRIIYNVVLVPPSFVSFVFGAMSSGGGNDSLFQNPRALLYFVAAAFGANVCYSFVYALEFWWASFDRDSTWNTTGRPLTLAAGCVLGAILAWIGGLDIAWMVYAGPKHGF